VFLLPKRSQLPFAMLVPFAIASIGSTQLNLPFTREIDHALPNQRKILKLRR
jgi:hypothetical protein